eukprot:9849310-Karenia_brevis.AAC.1
MWWKIVPLSAPRSRSDGLTQWIDAKAGTWTVNETAETEHLLFYPPMPGDVQFRNRWCMKKRNKPMVSAPHNPPMPDSQNSREAAS